MRTKEKYNRTKQLKEDDRIKRVYYNDGIINQFQLNRSLNGETSKKRDRNLCEENK